MLTLTPRKLFHALITSICVLVLLTNGFVEAAPPEGYQLVWSDEFEGEHLNLDQWNYRTDSKHWSTQMPSNVRLADGYLLLELKKESAEGKAYTGSGIISKESFKYGYYEARFRVPEGGGWHTSFWLMWHDASGGTNPQEARQEIDICEQDSVDVHAYKVNLHDWEGAHQSFGWKKIKTEDLSSSFHVWGCEFTEKTVRYYFEGEIVQEIDATQLGHGEHHIWLTSIASHLGDTRAVDDSKLPSAAIFDYIRFYKK